MEKLDLAGTNILRYTSKYEILDNKAQKTLHFVSDFVYPTPDENEDVIIKMSVG